MTQLEFDIAELEKKQKAEGLTPGEMSNSCNFKKNGMQLKLNNMVNVFLVLCDLGNLQSG